MNVRVDRATLADETTFRNLFQFYEYDFSRFTGWRVNAAGRFMELDLDGCWTDVNRHPFLIRADGDLAGLAIVDRWAESALSGEKDVRELTEFFVLAAFRRQGIGRQAATILFDLFPGKWQVRQLAANREALPFWRAVIERYTAGQWREATYDDERWRGTAQFFDNSGRGGVDS